MSLSSGPRPPPPLHVQEQRNKANDASMALHGPICSGVPKYDPVLRKSKRKHFTDFRDTHEVLRDPLGRFAKETTARHKRPKRIPWKVPTGM